MKHSKHFIFRHDIKRKVVRDLKLIEENLSVLITGKAYCDPNVSILDPYEKFTVDIETIYFNGTDVKELLEFTTGIEDFEEAAVKNAAHIFDEPEFVVEELSNDLFDPSKFVR